MIEREEIVAIPLTLRQLVATLLPFTGAVPFEPARLRSLLHAWVDAARAAETGEQWLAGSDAALRHWLAGLGAPPPLGDPALQAVPLPLL